MASHANKRKAIKDLLKGPPFTPSAKMRQQVEAMAAYGVPQDVIASLTLNPKTEKPISETTLKKYFAAELANGVWKLVADIGQTLAQSARGTPNIYDERTGKLLKAERPPSDTAAIFLLKARGGYRDRVTLEATGKDGQPTGAQIVIAIVPTETKL